MEFREVDIFSGKNATEDRLLRLKSPSILHIATHGFFIKNQDINERKIFNESGLASLAFEPSLNPMRRSGLIFASANNSFRTGSEYGIVSSEKISSLNLSETELVVLSACDTGLGELSTNEGVYGLKRSFLASGANSLIVSLWSVPSVETTELMSTMYDEWSSGKTFAEALRNAKIKLMKTKSNPYYWGAFVYLAS